MFVDYLIKRGRIFIDLKDLLALVSASDDTLTKQQVVEGIIQWHDKIVQQDR